MTRDAASLGRYYPANPAYGTGVFRRRLRMVAAGASIRAAVNDPWHVMWVTLALDGGTIADAAAGMDRTPKTVCPGAARALRELVGMQAETASAAIFSDGRAGRNCTHLLDLARLALGCHLRGEAARVLDLTVPDPDAGGQSRLTAAVDGTVVHDWILQDGRLSDAAGFQGGFFDPGFLPAMRDRFQGIELEAARALRMAVFVAAGRAYVTDGPVPVRALDETDRHGDCFAFSLPVLADSQDNIGYVQDFTDGLIERLPPVFGARP
ncbi:DUF2889 domain-containing protein [Gemmobacter sp.]|uniref:DUF2889 domain-containing protein n=1 Tax=Gemmobacter sp. TaxID=1898957 RepID=UPI002AFED51D|nr:DUF2889 domain-containing protein [Gemmobacter sp.]